MQWVEVDGNNAHIGFDPVPEDVDMVVRFAALNGNKATDFGFHASGVKASAGPGWRPGNPGLIVEHTARHGKIED